MSNLFMHHQSKLIEKKRKKIEYPLHESGLLLKEYFRIQRNLFNSLKPKILYLQKKNS